MTSSKQNAFVFLSRNTDVKMGCFEFIAVCSGRHELFLPPQIATMCPDRLGDAGQSSWEPTFWSFTDPCPELKALSPSPQGAESQGHCVWEH